MTFGIAVALQLLLLLFTYPAVALADDKIMAQSSPLEVITTTACNNIRFDGFQARLDMFYFYFVEYKDTNVELDLVGIENALAISIASALDDCDERNRPVYALEISSRHILSEGGKLLQICASNIGFCGSWLMFNLLFQREYVLLVKKETNAVSFAVLLLFFSTEELQKPKLWLMLLLIVSCEI